MTLHTPVQEFIEQCFEYFGPISSKAEAICGGVRAEGLRDIREFARSTGHRLRYSSSQPAAHPGLSTILDDVRYIQVKRGLSPNSEIYTIAHEIGHHQLDLSTPTALPKPTKEADANIFAIALLLRLAPNSMVNILSENRDGYFAGGAIAIGGAAVAVTALTSWLLKRI